MLTCQLVVDREFTVIMNNELCLATKPKEGSVVDAREIHHQGHVTQTSKHSHNGEVEAHQPLEEEHLDDKMTENMASDDPQRFMSFLRKDHSTRKPLCCW